MLQLISLTFIGFISHAVCGRLKILLELNTFDSCNCRMQNINMILCRYGNLIRVLTQFWESSKYTNIIEIYILFLFFVYYTLLIFETFTH